MQAAEVRRAVAAAMATASELDLEAESAIVLNDSNRLVVRLVPCDIVARVTPAAHLAHASAEQEVELVRSLAHTDSPAVSLDARVEALVFERDGFQITMWTYFEHVRRVFPPSEYAEALMSLHSSMRQVDVQVPHFMDRVAAVKQDAASRDVTPDLADSDRSLLADTLDDLSRSIVNRQAREQLLHGEPHPGNVLHAPDGPRFMDFENTARGPVEYDLGWVPKDVSERYPAADPVLVDECRGLVLAMVAMYRWHKDDQHPSGRRSGAAFLNVLRRGPPWPALDDVHW